ncbi:uncharacterized protein LOC144714970 [Wolffia australiana]
MEGDGEERREASLAACPLLQPGFKPSKVSQLHIEKFRELHKLRLKMKESWKEKGKRKVNANSSSKKQKTELTFKEYKEKGMTALQEASTPAVSMSYNNSADHVEVASALKTKKKQKLHWGLDTRERWERKSNM